ncbi:MAG: cell division protein ZapA [Candidatus Omnitrophota bacterium]|nr:cell division protein ZapA [Candidatus Omnitrophota bacterium]
MKRTEISITVLGEAYDFSGDPARIRRAAGLFQETLEQARKENRGKDISTHRLGAMTGMALAEQLVILQDRQEKKTDLVNSLQSQVKGLIEILERSCKNKPDV